MSNNDREGARRRRFDRVIAQYYKDMYRFAGWLCRDTEVAEVVVQESLLRAWRSLDALRDDAAARQWLLTIVRRENARYFEAKRVPTVDIDELTPAQKSLIASNEDPDLAELRQAIFQLEDGYREPLVLQVLMGYSTNEIAEFMGIRPGTVLTRLHRARLKLKEFMEPETRECAARKTDEL